jgi:hypothetical protein
LPDETRSVRFFAHWNRGENREATEEINDEKTFDRLAALPDDASREEFLIRHPRLLSPAFVTRLAHYAEPLLRARVIETLSTRFQSHVDLDDLKVSVSHGLLVSGKGLRMGKPIPIRAELKKGAQSQPIGRPAVR